MRLLIVNANTSEHVTEMMCEAALELPVPDLMVRGLTPETGPAIIMSRFENDIAARGLIELAVTHAGEADAILTGVSYDTGLKALRELLSIPVVGMTHSALLAASAVGDRIGLVGLGPRTEPLYRDVVAAHGFADRIAAWRMVELPAAFEPGDRTAVDRHLAGVATEFAIAERLDVVVLLGAVMAGAATRLRDHVPVPVLDGLTTGVLMAEMLVSMELRKAGVGAYAGVSGRRLTGVAPALADLAARGSGGA